MGSTVIELSAISSITRKINSRMPLGILLSNILDVAKELANAEGASILLSDKKTGDLIFNIVIGEKGNIIRGEKVPKGKGIAGMVAKTCQAMIVNDSQNDPHFFHEIDQKSNFKTRNVLCLPMIVIDETVGVLEIVNAINREGFDEDDLNRSLYLADQAAIAINSRQLFDELNRKIEEVTALYKISQSVAFADPNDDLLEGILSSITGALRVEKASLAIYDKKNHSLKLEASIGLPLEKGSWIAMEKSVAGHIFKTGEPLIVSDLQTDADNKFISHGSYKTGSFISIPVFYKNKTMGVLSLADRLDKGGFDTSDFQILSTIASQIAEIYQNLMNQKNMENQKKLAREIEIAAEIQKKNLPVLPAEVYGHQIAAFNRPAKEVGGDFYDYFPIDDTTYGVLVADIAGKGIPAALYMGSVRNIIRAERRSYYAPKDLFQSTNRHIYRESESGMFLTAVYMVIQTKNRNILFANSGHGNQLLFRGQTGEAISLQASGRPLGVTEDSTYEQGSVDYQPGDILLLFTDGVSEFLGGENLDIDIGEERLINIARQFLDKTPERLIKALKRYVDQYKGNKEFLDDFTIVAIKF